MKSVGRCVLWACVVAGLSVGYRLPKKMVFEGLGECENIFLYDTLLLVSDAVNGLIVYSVADASAPEYLQAIPLREHTGVAVVGEVVYANSGGSILALSLVSDSSYRVLSVIGPPTYYHEGSSPVNEYHGGGLSCGGPSEAVSVSNDAGSGAGGSYAVFAVAGTHLYHLRGGSLVTVDVSNPKDPREIGDLYINWSVETIFSTGEHLYIGAPDGMFVVDIARPSQPELISSVGHFRSCDPVVVQGSYAYVTLRAGGTCGGTQSRLMVVDVSDPADPYTVFETFVDSPWGLCVRENSLFVAFGTAGFGLYDVAEPSSPRFVQSWGNHASKDFIWRDNHLFLMGFDRITILDVADPTQPIPVGTVH